MAQRTFSAEEAARTLNVSLETIYAYVSRGKIRSETTGGGPREKRYSAEDVLRLKQRKGYRHSPDRGAERALDWGLPVLESALTFIDNGKLYYRGQNAIELADRSSFEEVTARFLGTTVERLKGEDPAIVAAAQHGLLRKSDCSPLLRLQALLPEIAAVDAEAYRLTEDTAARKCTALLSLAVTLATQRLYSEFSDTATRLATAWCPRAKGVKRLINGALVLSIDHELNVSSFVARNVASARSSLHQVIIAALAAMHGTLHGGSTLRIEALWDEIEHRGDVEAALHERTQRGETIPGFGHRLYPGGDPRAHWLLQELSTLSGTQKKATLTHKIAAHGRRITGDSPNIDFALVAVRRQFQMPRHAALTLFTLGRMVGWTAHAIEQAQSPGLIRPRAKYIGLPPMS